MLLFFLFFFGKGGGVRLTFHAYSLRVGQCAIQPVHTETLNPKCVDMTELYGDFNDLTAEWTDGLASSILRRNAQQEGSDQRWTVFDGPIDAGWVENMNTVLDDNMMLCLPNGERIKLSHNMRILFEAADLEVASPATVSRLGVVYMTPNGLGWRPLVDSWLHSPAVQAFASAAACTRLSARFSTLVAPFLAAYRAAAYPEHEPTNDANVVAALCRLFTTLCTNAELVFRDSHMATLRNVDRVLVFCMVWALGGACAGTHWPQFDRLLRQHLELDKVDAGLPPAGLCFDYRLNLEKGGQHFAPWRESLGAFEPPPSVPLYSVMVPTVDTVRYTFVASQLFQQQHHVFLGGVTGTGKTAVLTTLLRSLGVDTATSACGCG